MPPDATPPTINLDDTLDDIRKRSRSVAAMKAMPNQVVQKEFVDTIFPILETAFEALIEMSDSLEALEEAAEGLDEVAEGAEGPPGGFAIPPDLARDIVIGLTTASAMVEKMLPLVSEGMEERDLLIDYQKWIVEHVPSIFATLKDLSEAGERLMAEETEDDVAETDDAEDVEGPAHAAS